MEPGLCVESPVCWFVWSAVGALPGRSSPSGASIGGLIAKPKRWDIVFARKR